MIDEGLISRCIRQERKAQFELYRALYRMLMSICSRYEHNRQDALARLNQGFLKILTNLERRRPEVPFEPWARRIMINTVIDHFRKERERREMEQLDTPQGPDPTNMNGYLENMEGEAFAQLMQRVPATSRNVFNLFAVDGYSHAEIAAMLGISEGTSKWHVAHARAILQRALAEGAIPFIPNTAVQ
jgi:RNA polymerase sigma factor (sigma-70 family)